MPKKDRGIRCSITGIRSGEVIQGLKGEKQSDGVVMVVGKGDGKKLVVPPFKRHLSNLSEDILEKFNNISFFKSMDHEGIEQYLSDNSVAKDPYISDYGDLDIKFISISNKEWSTELGDKNIKNLLSGRYFKMSDVYAMFPRKPGSKAARHTLRFRSDIWKVKKSINKNVTIVGNILDLDNRSFQKSKVVLDDTIAVREVELDSGKIHIVSEIHKKLGVEEYLYELSSSMNIDFDTLSEVADILQKASLPLHKSIIQKIIRTRVKKVGEYDAKVVLLVSFTILMTSPGSNNQKLNIFITGLESATKRLAVSIGEDSYGNREDLTMLLAVPLLKRAVPEYFPSLTNIKMWWKIALNAYKEKRMFHYKTQVKDVGEKFSLLNGSFYLLEKIGSFSGDIGLFSYVIDNKIRSGLKLSKIDVLPFHHFIDQHNYPEVVYYMSYETYFRDGNRDIKSVMDNIWKMSSMVNTRRGESISNSPMMGDIRRAQYMIWFMLFDRYEKSSWRSETGEAITFNTELNRSWLSGLLGVLEVAGNYIMLHPDRIEETLVIKRPVRDRKDESHDVDEDEAKNSIDRANLILKKGVKAKRVPKSLPFDDVFITLKQDKENREYYFNGMSWDKARFISYSIPLLEPIEVSLSSAVTAIGDGFDEDHVVKFQELLDNTDYNVITRCMIHINNTSYITMFQVGRQGGGNGYSVTNQDVGVFQFLCNLSVIYPSAIVLKEYNRFRITNGPIFWSIVSMLRSYIMKNSTAAPSKMIIKPDKVKPWPHQTESCEIMINRTKSGERGNIVWIDPGMGKTRIIMMYMHKLLVNNLLPKYVVYTLPNSAYKSVTDEFKMFSMKFKKISANIDGDREFKPYMINVVPHSHMYKLDKELSRISSDLLLIVDEFHETMAETKKTTAMLSLASCCKLFVAMTGTLIKDKHTEHLIMWLKYVVDFEVNKFNYWVAVGALVSKKVKTKVIEVTKTYNIPITSDEYKRYIPRRWGGTADSIDFQGAMRICHNTVMPEMIKKIKSLVESGEVVFVVTLNKEQQNHVARKLSGLRVQLITKDHSVNLTPESKKNVDVVITTNRHNTGYNMTISRHTVMSVYPSNEAGRTQIRRRTNRIGQTRSKVYYHIFYAGVLRLLYENYESCKSLNEMLRSLADSVDIEKIDNKSLF